MENHADGLFRFIYRHVRDEEKAKDIVQDTFEKLWMKVADVDPEKAKSYLFTTGYRTMIDWIRKWKKQADWADHYEDKLNHSEGYSDLNEILHKALETLPEVQRTVVLLRDYEGYNYKEIGDITDLTESQVKVYIYRARVALKNYLVSIDYVI